MFEMAEKFRYGAAGAILIVFDMFNEVIIYVHSIRSG